MDKTDKLRNLILSRYNSIREFSKAVDIPSTTLTSSLDRGVGGMAIDRIIKICEVLNIDIKTFEPLETQEPQHTISEAEKKLLNNYNKLNDLGKKKLIAYSEDLIGNLNYSNIIQNGQLPLFDKYEDEKDFLRPIAAHNDTQNDPEQQQLIKNDLAKLRVKKNANK